MTVGKKRPIGLLLFLLIAAILVVPKLISINTTTAASETPSSRDDTVLVKAVELAPEPIEERLQTSGNILAAEQVELVSEEAGKVEKILFEEGRRVRAGDLLIKMDDAELVAALTRLDYQLQLAEQREKRQQQLLSEGVISQQEYERVLSELNVLRAERNLLETRRLKTEIRAPFAGVIGLRQVSLGSFLSPNTRIATLQALDRVKIDFSVPEKYASVVGLGREIQFRVKSSDQPFTGRITAIEPKIDSQTRSLLIRAECSNREGLLWPGAFADVELVVREVQKALAVPSLAVLPELGGKKVFVVEEGKAQPRQVETGIRTDDRVQILSGVEAGDLVIISGLQRLRTGIEVAVEGASEDRASEDRAAAEDTLQASNHS